MRNTVDVKRASQNSGIRIKDQDHPLVSQTSMGNYNQAAEEMSYGLLPHLDRLNQFVESDYQNTLKLHANSCYELKKEKSYNEII